MTSHGINMADQKFAQDVQKMTTLEGYIKGPVIIYGRGGEGKNKGGPYV